MTMATTCQHCLKPIEDCKKQDDSYIRPLRKDPSLMFEDLSTETYHDRCLLRLLGLYSKDEDKYYCITDDINYGEYYDTYLMLPFCAFKDNYKNHFYVVKRYLSRWFIEDLGIEEDYKWILTDLITTEINHNFN